MYYSSRYIQESKAEFKNLAPLVTDKLVRLASLHEHIALFGPSGSGKSIIGNILAERLGYPHYRSDNLLESTTHRERPYVMMKEVMAMPRVLFSGNAVARGLRIGIREHKYVPGMIIEIVCNEMSREATFQREGIMSKFAANEKYYKGNLTVIKEWHSMVSSNFAMPYPTIIKLDTSYL